MRKAAVGLLKGDRVESSDDKVQISWVARSAASGEIVVRDSSVKAQHLFLLEVEALSQAEIDRERSPDPAGLASPPGSWITVHDDVTQWWELFNCRVTLADIKFK